MTKNGIDVDESVSNDYVVRDSEFDGRYTKTSLFLMPAIGFNIHSSQTRPYFVNAFLDDKGCQHEYERPIFVLLKTRTFSDTGWKRLNNELQKKPEFITSYDCGTQNEHDLIMYVFQCNDFYKDDYYNFRKGKYSKFSDAYKKKFSEIIIDEKGHPVKSIMYGVINRTDEMKKKVAKMLKLEYKFVNEELEELWERPRREREYYRFLKTEQNGTDSSEKEGQSKTEEPFAI